MPLNNLQVSDELIANRDSWLESTLKIFRQKVEHEQLTITAQLALDKFIKEAIAYNKELSKQFGDDNQYRAHLKEELSQLAVKAFPTNYPILRLIFDIIISPLFFLVFPIKKAITGSWFFSSAESKPVTFFKSELLNFDEAVKQKKWSRVIELLTRGEKISDNLRDDIAKTIVSDWNWKMGYELEKRINKEVYILTEGPLQKTDHTIQLEELTHKLLTLQDFSIEGSMDAFVLKFQDGQECHVNDIFKHANLDHLILSDSDLTLYATHFVCAEQQLYAKNLQQQFPHLHVAEIVAINKYTGYGYGFMNSLLRGQYDFRYSIPARSRLDILTTVMCASGLGKIPDMAIGTCYRGENLFDNSEHYKRIQAAAAKGVIQLSGFVSTSTSKSSAFYGDVTFAFENLKGKYLGSLSSCSREKEFLVLPTQVQIEIYEYKWWGNHFFNGKMVCDLALHEKGLSIEPDRNVHPMVP